MKYTKKNFEEVYTEHYRFIYNSCRTRVPLNYLEDVVQNVFFKCYKNLDKYNSNKGEMRAWIYAVAKNECANAHGYVQKNFEVTLDTRTLEYFDNVKTVQDESSQEIFDVQWKLVNDCLGRLKPRQQRVIKLKYFDGLTNRRIAFKIKKKEANVRKINSRAIKELRSMVLSTNG